MDCNNWGGGLLVPEVSFLLLVGELVQRLLTQPEGGVQAVDLQTHKNNNKYWKSADFSSIARPDQVGSESIKTNMNPD